MFRTYRSNTQFSQLKNILTNKRCMREQLLNFIDTVFIQPFIASTCLRLLFQISRYVSCSHVTTARIGGRFRPKNLVKHGGFFFHLLYRNFCRAQILPKKRKFSKGKLSAPVIKDLRISSTYYVRQRKVKYSLQYATQRSISLHVISRTLNRSIIFF